MIGEIEMKLLARIDDFLDRMNAEVDPRITEARKEGGKEYDSFFNSMLKKWKVKSYKDLPKDKQKKFFDEVDKKWNAKKETD